MVKKKHIRYSIYVGYEPATNHVYTKFLANPPVCLIERCAKQQVGGFSIDVRCPFRKQKNQHPLHQPELCHTHTHTSFQTSSHRIHGTGISTISTYIWLNLSVKCRSIHGTYKWLLLSTFWPPFFGLLAESTTSGTRSLAVRNDWSPTLDHRKWKGNAGTTES